MNVEQQRALLVQLGMIEELKPEQALEEAEVAPDFDGGAREPAPLRADPVTSHNEFLLEQLDGLPPRGLGRGGLW